jgi:hypothetical protein
VSSGDGAPGTAAGSHAPEREIVPRVVASHVMSPDVELTPGRHAPRFPDRMIQELRTGARGGRKLDAWRMCYNVMYLFTLSSPREHHVH